MLTYRSHKASLAQGRTLMKTVPLRAGNADPSQVTARELRLRWALAGVVYPGSSQPRLAATDAPLSSATLSATVAGTTDTTVPIYRDGVLVGTATLAAGALEQSTIIGAAWDAANIVSFDVAPGTGLEGLTIELVWSY